MGFLSDGPKESAAQQKANAKLRKGTKRPEHGEWPVAGKKQGTPSEANKARKKIASKSVEGIKGHVEPKGPKHTPKHSKFPLGQ